MKSTRWMEGKERKGYQQLTQTPEDPWIHEITQSEVFCEIVLNWSSCEDDPSSGGTGKQS